MRNDEKKYIIFYFYCSLGFCFNSCVSEEEDFI